MSEERILERVRKMLALANDEAATEGERDNALRMAHNLLAKHQLDLEDVEHHAKEKLDPRGRFNAEGWSMAWTHGVRATVAKLFMCDYFYGDKVNATRCKHSFIGREAAATTAMYMSEYIVTSILKEGRKRFGHNLSPETRSFAMGCASRLHLRVEEMRRTKQAEVSGSGSELVLQDVAEAEEAANRAFLEAAGTKITVTKSRQSAPKWDAYTQGSEFGKGIGLNTQVTNRKGTLAIGNK